MVVYYIMVNWELVWWVCVCDVICGLGWGIARGEKQSGNDHYISYSSVEFNVR